MKLNVFTKEGKDTGKQIELPASVFGMEKPSDHAIYQDVRQILANRRQGTSKSKGRSEVHGTGKKPYRQKGTGSARAGDRKSPLWRHGGTVFGPQPRDYGFKLNKKVKQLARKSALSYKAQGEGITVVENFSMDKPRTKDFVAMLNALKIAGEKVLMILPEDNQNVYRSGRNLPNARIIPASQLNTYDVLNATRILLVDDAISKIEENLG